MTNETEVPSSDDACRLNSYQQNLSVPVSHPNEEGKRRVSISQLAIQTDIEKQNRKSSCMSSKSSLSPGDGAANCYVNPTFQHCPSGNEKFK